MMSLINAMSRSPSGAAFDLSSLILFLIENSRSRTSISSSCSTMINPVKAQVKQQHDNVFFSCYTFPILLIFEFHLQNSTLLTCSLFIPFAPQKLSLRLLFPLRGKLSTYTYYRDNCCLTYFLVRFNILSSQALQQTGMKIIEYFLELTTNFGNLCMKYRIIKEPNVDQVNPYPFHLV